MQCLVFFFSQINGPAKHRIRIKTAVNYCVINLGKILRNVTPCANMHMAHFRIAHLSARQSYNMTGTIEQRHRAVFLQLIPTRCISHGNGIVFFVQRVTESVKDQQYHRLWPLQHLYL
jgi:hypothetical protein